VREFQQSTLTRPVPHEFFETIVEESLKVPARVWKSALEPYTTVDFSDRIKVISVPTLVIWGDRDAFTPRAEQDAISKSIAGSRLVVYAGTGHCPHWEEPARFAGDLIAFVNGIQRQGRPAPSGER
jgi:pimeloyl-ACP methyl ester carboxylesterase